MDKPCTKCLKMKNTSEFFRCASHKTGFRPECKDCNYKIQKRYRKTTHGKIVYERTVAKAKKTPKYKSYMKNYLKKYIPNYRKQFPEKQMAHEAVALAVKNGILPNIETQFCVSCWHKSEGMENRNFTKATHYHHHSYEPKYHLLVTPLCARCHRLRHSFKMSDRIHVQKSIE